MRHSAGAGERSGDGGLFTPTRDRALVLVWVVAACFVVVELHAGLTAPWGLDSVNDWTVWSKPVVYDLGPETTGFLYSPACAQAFYPLTLLPWIGFSLLWLGLGLCAYLWLIQPIGWAWGIPLFALALEDLRCGNVVWLMALASVAGIRRGAPWTVPLFLKITPAVGALWFGPRREWRELGWFFLTSIGIFAVSYATVPGLWRAWWVFLLAHHGALALPRVASAGALVLWASRSDRPWIIPFAMVLASPVFAIYVFGFLCTLPRVLSTDAIAWARAPFGGIGSTVKRALDLS